MVVYSRNQLESQSESSAPVAIAIGYDLEALEAADHMLDDDALRGELAVGASVVPREFGSALLLARYRACGVDFRDTPIAGIAFDVRVFPHERARSIISAQNCLRSETSRRNWQNLSGNFQSGKMISIVRCGSCSRMRHSRSSS